MGIQSNIRYTDNLSEVDITALQELLASAVPNVKARSEEEIKQVFEGSNYRLFAYDGEDLVAAIRAISDGEWAVLYDAAMKRGYQETFQDLVLQFIEVLHGQHIFITADPEEMTFYESIGFQRTKTAFTYAGKNAPSDTKEIIQKSRYYLPVGYRFENELTANATEKNTKTSSDKKAPKKDANLKYTEDFTGVDFKRVSEILLIASGREVDLARENTEERIGHIKHLFEISEYVEFAFDGDLLVGVSRVITDGGENGYLQNVAVDPTYQGYGIGFRLVTELGERLGKEGLVMFLHTHPGAVGFYNRQGFLRNKTSLDYLTDFEKNMPKEKAEGFFLPIGYRFPDELEEYENGGSQ